MDLLFQILEDFKKPIKERDGERMQLKKEIIELREQFKFIDTAMRSLRSVINEKDRNKDRGLDYLLK